MSCRSLRTRIGYTLLVFGFLAIGAPMAAAGLTSLELEMVATGLDGATSATHAGDDRIFIILQDGRVLVLTDAGLEPVPFLDIRDRVFSSPFQGLLGIAFHPRYAENGFFFVHHTGPGGDVVIARYRVSAQPNRADPASEAVLLRVPKVFGNHNGGQLHIGPDGYLYVAIGDSGSADDPLCVAQAATSLEGKLLRLDVDRNVDTPPYYAIPPDNPFLVPSPSREEIWALGLRNPWRFSFDRASGDLFIADVGEAEREEVNRQPAASAGGINYGWKRMEGSVCRDDDTGCATPPPPCGAAGYTAPILEYDHGAGDCSITGGYVYRGLGIPALAGYYLYGDFCSGRLWAAREEGGGWRSELLGLSLPGVVSFAEDRRGELYLLTASTLYRLRDPAATCDASATALCLNGNRFRAEITFRRTVGGGLESGQAEPLTSDAGFFWFFDRDNPEIFVKVLTACVPPFNSYWVFAAGLTDVETHLTVVDTLTGAIQRYDKPLGSGFAPIRDTAAFACP